MSGWQAEVCCGEGEVLVKAAHQIRAGLLRQDHSGCPLTHDHLLFDQHEIVSAEGLWSERIFPVRKHSPRMTKPHRRNCLICFLNSQPCQRPMARQRGSRLVAQLLGSATA